MKLLKAEVNNFGSYQYLEFDFESQGLALIYGATGSGKSTLQDIAAWILYGITAKDGNADEIRSWTNLEEPTTGVIDVEINGQLIGVWRIRGKASQNDLYWHEGDNPVPIRGKDITETQKLLEERLGVSAELYISAACYNEFSPTSNFFTSKAKDKRELFEKIAEMDFPVQLAERIIDVRKETKKDLLQGTASFNKAIGRLEQLRSSAESSKIDAAKWSKNQTRIIEEIKAKGQSFEKDKKARLEVLQSKSETYEKQKSEKINKAILKSQALEAKMSLAVDTRCTKCGNVKEPIDAYQVEFNNIIKFIEDLQDTENTYIQQIQDLPYNFINHYDCQLANELNKINPFLSQIDTINCDIITLQSHKETLEKQIVTLERKITALTQLHDLTFNLRGELLKKAVKQIESETNRYLETYFDSEIRVEFSLEESDDLIVSISKNGHSCVFKQLSKGQRSLLKLCFSVSIMKASANRVGVHFSTLFFDESLDGLDTELKLKAFGLFSELSLQHETILVIDHSEDLRSLFDKHYHVTLSEDISKIEVR